MFVLLCLAGLLFVSTLVFAAVIRAAQIDRCRDRALQCSTYLGNSHDTRTGVNLEQPFIAERHTEKEGQHVHLPTIRSSYSQGV